MNETKEPKRMQVRRTAKPGEPVGFVFHPDDSGEELKVGDIVEVSEHLGLALIQRGWGEDVEGRLVIEREPDTKELVERAERLFAELHPDDREGRAWSFLRADHLEREIERMEAEKTAKAEAPKVRVIRTGEQRRTSDRRASETKPAPSAAPSTGTDEGKEV